MGTSTKTVQYRYDTRGNRSALIDHDGGRFTYSYDSVNRLTQVVNPQGDRTSYSYDSAGRRTLKKLSNGTRASFTYDAASNLTKLGNLKNDGTVLSSFDYKYDKTGNRTAVLESDSSRVTWSYDDADQLTGEHRTGANPYRDTYTYDPAGNRLLKNRDGARTTYAYDAANQLTYSQDGSGRTTFTFDADGNQQEVREPSGNRTTYAWDYENRMTSARLPSGIRNTMAYDADGLRVKLEESTGTKKFVWDDQNYLGETDASNDTQVIYTNEPLMYGNLVSQRRASTSHWYHFDALGSTRELTDVSAVVTDTRLYDAWGNAVATTGSTMSPLRWVGDVAYYFDAEMGSYYVRARVYQPTLTRWMSADPIWITKGDVYLYSYVGNRVLLHIDPSGLIKIIPGTSTRVPNGQCGQVSSMQYKWQLERNEDRCPNENRWIVQFVLVVCGVSNCVDCDTFIGENADPNDPRFQTFGYFEAWHIPAGVPWNRDDVRRQLVDTASAQAKNGTCGVKVQKGRVFLLCQSDPDVDFLGTYGRYGDKWTPHRTYGTGDCVVNVGPLPSISAEEAGKLNPTLAAIVKGAATRKFGVIWCCCPKADRFVRAYSDPPPAPDPPPVIA